MREWKAWRGRVRRWRIQRHLPLIFLQDSFRIVEDWIGLKRIG